jgi:hypothetical protein
MKKSESIQKLQNSKDPICTFSQQLLAEMKSSLYLLGDIDRLYLLVLIYTACFKDNSNKFESVLQTRHNSSIFQSEVLSILKDSFLEEYVSSSFQLIHECFTTPQDQSIIIFTSEKQFMALATSIIYNDELSKANIITVNISQILEGKTTIEDSLLDDPTMFFVNMGHYQSNTQDLIKRANKQMKPSANKLKTVYIINTLEQTGNGVNFDQNIILSYHQRFARELKDHNILGLYQQFLLLSPELAKFAVFLIVFYSVPMNIADGLNRDEILLPTIEELVFSLKLLFGISKAKDEARWDFLLPIVNIVYSSKVTAEVLERIFSLSHEIFEKNFPATETHNFELSQQILERYKPFCWSLKLLVF